MLNTESQYRQEWAAKSGRPESEVYVPSALRAFSLEGDPRRALGTADIVRPLAAGDRVRILVDNHKAASVMRGDVLTVTRVESESFCTDTPRLQSNDLYWSFDLADEGSDWERVW